MDGHLVRIPGLLRQILARAFSSSAPVSSSASHLDAGGAEYLDFPGGKVPLTGQLTFLGGPQGSAGHIPTYRTIDMAGRGVEGAHVPHPLEKELSAKLYKTMAMLQVGSPHAALWAPPPAGRSPQPVVRCGTCLTTCPMCHVLLADNGHPVL
jgi:hypothetical protein